MSFDDKGSGREAPPSLSSLANVGFVESTVSPTSLDLLEISSPKNKAAEHVESLPRW